MTSQNYNIVIADTSVLILLDKISRLHILPMLFPRILITKIVAEEFNQELPSEFEIFDNSQDKTINVIELTVDKGEASSIALGMDMQNSLLIVDDKKARNLCKQLKMNYVGTISVLLKAVKVGIIKDSEALIKNIEETNFRISKDLLDLLRQ